ncbi:hypothetical protein ACF0H5_017103 [Mactra antiquata]
MASISSEDKRIMYVGLCCLDIINICNAYPEEDTDQRSLDYYWKRGGNASNSCTVSSLLGVNVEFMGTLVKTREYGFMTSDLAKYDIKTENCAIYDGDRYSCPVAVAIISKQNGSRTLITALNNIVELEFSSFQKVQLQQYSWIHFEGRDNLSNIQQMMEMVEQYNNDVNISDRIIVSMELEKVKRKQLVPLMKKADYVFVSKDFAAEQGYSCKEDAVNGLIELCKPSGVIICAWGSDGAAAKAGSHDHVTSQVFSPEKVVDTLGAGDTFNAATILALNKKKTLKEAITFGCRIAGAKCGLNGFDDLRGMQTYL